MRRNGLSLESFLMLCALAGVTSVAFAETNIAPYCKVASTPYVGAAISYLTDGKLAVSGDNTLMMAAALPPRVGEVMPVQYEFTFPRRVRVTGVRLLQHNTQGRRPASGYIIELDITADGHYAKKVVEESRGAGGRWFAYRVSPSIEAYRLRFRTTDFAAGPGPNYGSAALEEFEILTDDDFSVEPSRPRAHAPILEAYAKGATTVASAGSNVPTPEAERFHRGLFGSMWLFWAAGQPYSEEANRAKFGLLEKLKVNRYWLYPGVYVPPERDLPYLSLPSSRDYMHFIDRQMRHSAREGMRIVPFPSTVVPGYKQNILKDFVAQMHKSGIRVIAVESLLPYGLGGWDFPRVVDPKVYPSVLASSFVRDASTTLYREFMQAGVDGLALGGDEFFLYADDAANEDASPVCRDATGSVRDICKPTASQLFKERFGLDPDAARTQFSPSAAMWRVFRYGQLADLFAGYSEMMKTTRTNAIVTSLFNPGQENRPAYGVAYDVMGANGAVDELSSDPYWSNDSSLGHYYFANETKKLAAASRSRTATITLQATPGFDRDGYKDPLMVYGPAFSALMHGIRGVNFYKQDYLFAGGRDDAGPWIERFFNLTALLESKGLIGYHVPKSVALLYSRASEDWWQLAHPGDPVAKAEATLFQNAVMEVLFRNGIPFDLYYLDQPSSLADVGQYAVALLPFPYSVSNAALTALRHATESGTKVIAVQRNGEVDEFAQLRRTPALNALSGLRRVVVDLAGSSYSDFSAKLLPVVFSGLGNRLPLTVDTDGKDIECAVLERALGRLVFCLNWEKQPVEVRLGIRLPPGKYAASVINLEREAPAGILGRSALTATDLENFRLPLLPGEAKIVSVTPARGDAPPH